eukprot:450212_1
MTMRKYEAKLTTFFQQFEIPELWDLHVLPKRCTDWEIQTTPPVIGLRKSKKIYYYSTQSNTESIIIVTPGIGIDRYNIQANTRTHLSGFPDGLNCDGVETVLNPNTGDLYLVGGKHKCLAIYNIERSEWSIKCLNDIDDDTHDAKYDLSIYSNHPKMIDNTLYISGWKCIRKYDEKKDKFIELRDDEPYPSSDYQTKLIHVSCINKYIHLGNAAKNALQNELWTFGIHNDTNSAWKLTKNGLPTVYNKLTLAHVACVENIIVLMYFNGDLTRNEMWLLEIDQKYMNRSTYCKSKCFLRQTFPRYFMYIGCDANVHAINFEGNDRNNDWEGARGAMYRQFVDETPFHLTVPLLKVIPDKVKVKYINMYKHLVDGFRKMIDVECDSQINDDLCALVQSYYSVFVAT